MVQEDQDRDAPDPNSTHASVVLAVQRGSLEGEEIRLIGTVFILGRHPASAVVAHSHSDHQVSRLHARIYRQSGQWWLEDLDTKNGTWLSGVAIQVPVSLRIGHHIALGRSEKPGALEFQITNLTPTD